MPDVTIKTQEELDALFPRYPKDPNNEEYMRCFDIEQGPEEVALMLEYLEKYGFVVVQALNEQQCKDAAQEMELDVNNAMKSKSQKTKVDFNVPSTWENPNWPAKSKFLFNSPPFGIAAMKNRTCTKIYEIYQHLYGGEKHLWTSLDNWGIMRGTQNLKFGMQLLWFVTDSEVRK